MNLREMELNLKMKSEFIFKENAAGEIQGVLNKYIGERLDDPVLASLNSELNSLLKTMSGDDMEVRIEIGVDGRILFVPCNQETQDLIDRIYANTKYEETY